MRSDRTPARRTPALARVVAHALALAPSLALARVLAPALALALALALAQAQAHGYAIIFDSDDNLHNFRGGKIHPAGGTREALSK